MNSGDYANTHHQDSLPSTTPRIHFADEVKRDFKPGESLGEGESDSDEGDDDNEASDDDEANDEDEANSDDDSSVTSTIRAPSPITIKRMSSIRPQTVLARLLTKPERQFLGWNNPSQVTYCSIEDCQADARVAMEWTSCDRGISSPMFAAGRMCEKHATHIAQGQEGSLLPDENTWVIRTLTEAKKHHGICSNGWRYAGQVCEAEGCETSGVKWTYNEDNEEINIDLCLHHAAQASQAEPLELRESLKSLWDQARARPDLHGKDNSIQLDHFLEHICLGTSHPTESPVTCFRRKIPTADLCPRCTEFSKEIKSVGSARKHDSRHGMCRSKDCDQKAASWISQLCEGDENEAIDGDRQCVRCDNQEIDVSWETAGLCASCLQSSVSHFDGEFGTRISEARRHGIQPEVGFWMTQRGRDEKVRRAT